MTKHLREFLLRKMLIIDCETCHYSVVFVSMTIFGQNIVWNVSIVTVLILALIQLLRVLWCPKHRRFFHRKFLSGGILEKQWRFEFSKLNRKVLFLPWQHTWGLIGGANFSEWKIPRKKSQISNSQLRAILKRCCDFGEGGGHNVPPGRHV